MARKKLFRNGKQTAKKAITPIRTVPMSLMRKKSLLPFQDYDLQRTDETLFKNYYQMLNIAQLSHATDSLNAEMEIKNTHFKHSLINYHYFKIREKNKPLGPCHASVSLPVDSLSSDLLQKDTITSFDSLYLSFDP